MNPDRDVLGPAVVPEALWANCALAVMAAEWTWSDRRRGESGVVYQAGGADPLPVLDLEHFAGREAVPATYEQVVEQLLAAGDGASGVVVFAAGGQGHGHAVNVFNDGGSVVLVDAQSGAWRGCRRARG